MKEKYYSPEINIEILEKQDILLDSKETENQRLFAKDFFGSEFSISSIL